MKSNIFKFLFVCFIANAFCLVFSVYVGIDRPYINIDYLLLLLVNFYPKNRVRSLIIILSYLLIFIIDLLLIILQIFPFIKLTDLIYLSSFIFFGPVIYKMGVILSFFYGIFSAILLKDFISTKLDLSLKEKFKFFTMIFFSIIILNALINVFINKINLFESRTLFFIKNNQSSFMDSNNMNPTELVTSKYLGASKPIYKSLVEGKATSDRILLVINESWGFASNPRVNEAIIEPLVAGKSKLSFIEFGSLGFSGATVNGELRELCQRQSLTFGLKQVDTEQFSNCLPNQLKKRGYKTHSLHGAKGELYDRLTWYPKAGFEDLNFYDQLHEGGQCLSFSGRCDYKLTNTVKENLLDGEKSFVYWLTLNTHTPYDDELVYDGFDCDKYNIKSNSESCLNLKLQYQFFFSLSLLLGDPKMSGVEIYVAGDHTPPMVNLRDNLFVFKGTEVAWLHFKIK